MASIITLKRRIGSIRNTRQITKAMQLVSASKLRRAQDFAMRSRAYRDLAYELLGRLGAISEVERQPMFSRRPVNARLYIVITSNSGLAGAYNANVLKQLTHMVSIDRSQKVASHAIVIGNKGAQFVRRLEGVELAAVYNTFGDQPTANDIRPILTSLVEGFEAATYDEVQLIYTAFVSNIVQQAKALQLLPALPPELAPESQLSTISNFEPDIETVIEEIGTRLVEAQLWQALLDSLASEHAMRMISMKNATDNANDLIHDYTLEYNTARQAGITQELAEITGGAEALNG